MNLFWSSLSWWEATLIMHVIGMFVIGYPIGYLSLKAWKHPERKWFSFWFFPLRTIVGGGWGKVGVPQHGADDASLIDMLDVSSEDVCGEEKEHLEKRANYIAITMVCWQWRVVANLLALVGACITLLITGTFKSPMLVARCLLLCRRCLRV